MLTAAMKTSSSTMPITTDSLLLADFVQVVDGQRILDLGTGSGIIALSLCARANVSMTGIDINEQAIEQARNQLDRERPLLKGSATFLHGDLRDAVFLQGLGAFDQVVCNPPYHRLRHGRIPASADQAAARHEITCTLVEVIRAASLALKVGGTFSLAHLPNREEEIMQELRRHSFSHQCIRHVPAEGHSEVRLILIRAMKEERSQS